MLHYFHLQKLEKEKGVTHEPHSQTVKKLLFNCLFFISFSPIIEGAMTMV